jgi:hypothetical protein
MSAIDYRRFCFFSRTPAILRNKFDADLFKGGYKRFACLWAPPDRLIAVRGL